MLRRQLNFLLFGIGRLGGVFFLNGAGVQNVTINLAVQILAVGDSIASSEIKFLAIRVFLGGQGRVLLLRAGGFVGQC